jgi:hypothetical protein
LDGKTTLWENPKLPWFVIVIFRGLQLPQTIMRNNKSAIVVFVAGCLIFSVQAQCVVITPSNIVLPDFVGDIFSFDFVILDATDTNITAFQATVNVKGPGSLTFNALNSEAVAATDGYWAFGNSGGTNAFVQDGNYVFGGDTSSGYEPLTSNDIMARYAFIWGGTEGDYTFILNLNTQNSFVQNEYYVKEPLEFTPGSYPGTNNSFTISIPEPGTLVIFVLGGSMVLLKGAAHKHSAFILSNKEPL